MGKPTGFKELGRQPLSREPVADRINHWREFHLEWSEQAACDQGARCMNCSVPFCMSGCPLGNIIPDFNDLVYRGKWQEALYELHSTNSFPEFTGRVCPAPCEASCVLNINDDPVTIEYIERTIADRGWKEGWIVPQPPAERTGKTVAVVGSGPAGLATAFQLNRAGHSVTVFERNESVGGLLRFGIPDFKLGKDVVQRRVDQMEAEGVVFKIGVNVGRDYPSDRLKSDFDAVCLTGGSTVGRDLPIPGRELTGVYQAIEFLAQQNRVNAGQDIPASGRISAEGKNVVVLGGGDTGSDCLGTAHRQGAAVVHQLELLPQPPTERPGNQPWPQWPMVLRTSSSQEEGGNLDFNILTKKFTGSDGKLEKLHAVRLEWGPPDATGRPAMIEIPGSEFELDVDLVLLAMGFVHPEPEGMLADLGVDLDPRGNVAADANKMTSVPGIFTAGDMTRGQSLVVWALAEGREAARGIDMHLMGRSNLPRSASTMPAM
jgi:glutamate synthase (NADPH/NADH) small chain